MSSEQSLAESDGNMISFNGSKPRLAAPKSEMCKKKKKSNAIVSVLSVVLIMCQIYTTVKKYLLFS